MVHQDSTNDSFLELVCPNMNRDLQVRWTNTENIKQFLNLLRSIHQKNFSDKDQATKINFLAGDLLIVALRILTNPGQYNCVSLHHEALILIDSVLFHPVKENKELNLISRFVCKGGLMKAKDIGIFDEILETLFKLIKKCPTDVGLYGQFKIQKNLKAEYQGNKFYLMLLEDMLEYLSIPNAFLSEIKKGKNRLGRILETLTVNFVKYSGSLLGNASEFPRLLRKLGIVFNNFSALLKAGSKSSPKELANHYTKLFCKILTGKLQNTHSQMEQERELAHCYDIASFLLQLAKLPFQEIIPEILMNLAAQENKGFQFIEECFRKLYQDFIIGLFTLCSKFGITEALNHQFLNVELLNTYARPLRADILSFLLQIKCLQESFDGHESYQINSILNSELLMKQLSPPPSEVWSLAKTKSSLLEYYQAISNLCEKFAESPELLSKGSFLMIDILEVYQKIAANVDSFIKGDFDYCIQSMNNPRLLFSKIFYDAFFKDAYFHALKSVMRVARELKDQLKSNEKYTQKYAELTNNSWKYLLNSPIFAIRRRSIDHLSYIFKAFSKDERFEFLIKFYENSNVSKIRPDIIIKTLSALVIDPENDTLDFIKSFSSWLALKDSKTAQDYSDYMKFLSFFEFCRSITAMANPENSLGLFRCPYMPEFILYYATKTQKSQLFFDNLSILEKLFTEFYLGEGLAVPKHQQTQLINYIQLFVKYLLKFIVLRPVRERDLTPLKPYFEAWNDRVRILDTSKDRDQDIRESLIKMRVAILMFKVQIVEFRDHYDLIMLIGKHNWFKSFTSAITSFQKLSRSKGIGSSQRI